MSNPNRFGSYVGTGAAIDIELGWNPDYVEVWNETDGDESWSFWSGMTAGHARKIAADGTQTRITANGVSPYAGVAASKALGFTIGTALSESGKTFRWKAHRAAD